MLQMVINIFDYFYGSELTLHMPYETTINDDVAIVQSEKNPILFFSNIIIYFLEMVIAFMGFIYFVIFDIKDSKTKIYRKCAVNIYSPFDCELIYRKILQTIKKDNDMVIEVKCATLSNAALANLQIALYDKFSKNEDFFEVLIPDSFKFETMNYIIAETQYKSMANFKKKKSVIICNNITANRFEMRNLIGKIYESYNNIKIIYLNR